MFVLEIRAPFAAFRWMQAGVYRGTSPVIPPSTAWGLVCNLAGIETRAPGEHVVTPIRKDAPRFRVAVARVGAPFEVASLYQQLHTYPVGNSGKELQLDVRARGAKYWIAPARREFLVDPHLLVAVDAEPALRGQVDDGLAGRGARAYGLPFLGDNQLLVDSIAVSDEPPCEAAWYERWDGAGPVRPGSCRLTTRIDREQSARTEVPLFAPRSSTTIPATAWVEVGPLGEPGGTR
jgi:CRISPR-associated protein Cas5t